MKTTWIAAVWFVGVATVTAPIAHAQVLDPAYAVPSYTTADPIDPTRLGLATPDGRFAIVPLGGCEWLSADYQPVVVYPNAALPPSLGLSAPEAGTPTCYVQVAGRMSATPCFTNDGGVCDATQEFDSLEAQ